MDATSVLHPASPQAAEILRLFWVVVGVAVVIFTVVASLVIYAAIRFRSRPGGPAPVQRDENTTLEVVWTVVPALILTGLFVLTVRVMHSVDPSPGGRTPDLRVIAHQWWWELRYPARGVRTANEIHLPVGSLQLLELESADVVHDFWVPALGKKVDVIPGHPNFLWLTIDRPGIYRGTCDEFCGVEHAGMRIRVVAEPPEKFDAWLRRQAAPPSSPSGEQAERGARLFRQRTCSSCHAVTGGPAAATLGPDLTHFASRETLASGVLSNTPENLARWLSDPQSVKPGCNMPDLHLGRGEVRALVAYLEQLN